MGQAKSAGLHTTSLKDLAGITGGTLNEFRVRANYRPTAKFSISASETWDRFRLPLPNGNFSGSVGKLAGKLFLYPLFDFHESDSGDTSNTQRSVPCSLEVQLPPRQRSLHHLQRRNAIRQHRPANPPQVRETASRSIHVFVATVRGGRGYVQIRRMISQTRKAKSLLTSIFLPVAVLPGGASPRAASDF